MLNTTSLSEPPSWFLTCFRSARGRSVQSNRRLGPMSGFSGVRSDVVSQPDRSDDMAAADLSMVRSARSRPSRTVSDRLVSLSMSRRVACAASETASWLGVGAGRGIHAGASSMSEVGITLRRIVVRSTPESPSIMQWWILAIIANRSSSSPSTTQSSHSGLLRSNGVETMRPASALSWLSVPGRGSDVCRTWYSKEN